MINFGLWPNKAIVEAAKNVWGIDLVDKGRADPFKLAILIESLVMMLTVAQLSPFCALRINRCLKDNSLSNQTKKLYRRMLILLSIQITFPVLLLHLPLCIMFFLLFTGLSSPPIVENFVGIAMTLDPVIGPIVTILFVKDYRKALLGILRIGKNQSST
ncbi:hypothetical protein COOONC_05150 [Cooperia oncophora]